MISATECILRQPRDSLSAAATVSNPSTTCTVDGCAVRRIISGDGTLDSVRENPGRPCGIRGKVHLAGVALFETLATLKTPSGK